MGIELDPSQRAAVDLMLEARLCVITGGPGVGKTTVTRTALDHLDARGVSYALAAPTGKAARRMEEATGREALTIHRLLGYRPGRGWNHDATYPLGHDVIIIDESSMVDVLLGEALFDAVDPARTRLVLVGDADQLPPVGPGNTFADLIRSGRVPVARLTKVHRQAEGSWVIRNAPRINRGEAIPLEPADDFRWTPIEDAAAVVDEVVRIAKAARARLPDDEDLQVLAPMRTSPCGVAALNTALQTALNPNAGRKAARIGGGARAWEGDRVIQVRNDYGREVMNGEVGDVVRVANGVVTVRFDGRLVTYDAGDAGALQLAYALTVHKSQGSEFAWVVVVCHSAHAHMLERQLLYTAATRAKRGLMLVGNEAGLKYARRRGAGHQRMTALAECIRARCEEGRR